MTTEREMLLTDEEITLIVRECARGSAINRDGSTSHRIARAVIAACEEKLREQEPVAFYERTKFYANEESAICGCADMAKLKPVFTHPAPIPELERGPLGWMQNIESALRNNIFQEMRALMGTENHGQDISLLQVLRKFRNRLLQSQPAPIPEGWQPIETAPKDGSRVLIKGDCTVVAGWEEITGMHGLMGWAIVNDAWMSSGEARYWMPLPKPPMAARSGE